MPDPDMVTSVLTHGGAVATGGGVAAWVVRSLFSGIANRLDKIEKALDRFGDKADQRHEDMVGRVAIIDKRADAAFRVVDDLKERVESLEKRKR